MWTVLCGASPRLMKIPVTSLDLRDGRQPALGVEEDDRPALRRDALAPRERHRVATGRPVRRVEREERAADDELVAICSPFRRARALRISETARRLSSSTMTVSGLTDRITSRTNVADSCDTWAVPTM